MSPRDGHDSYAAMEARMVAGYARQRRRQARLQRAEARDLILRERAQARALARQRPDKDERTLSTLEGRLARLEARLAGTRKARS